MRVRGMSVWAVLFGIVLVAAATPAAARQEPDTSGALEVLADGLDNPRGITVGWGNRIFVAEAGRGGDVLVDTPLGDSEGPVCVGNTGAITEIHKGKVRRVVEGLPSVAEAADGLCGGPFFGAGATGPHGVDVSRGRLTYSTGLGGTPEIRDLLSAALPVAGDLGLVNLGRNATNDLVALEAAIDPDGDGVDSNPYGITAAKGGATLAADAGGNSLLRLTKRNPPEVVAIFAPRCVPFNLGPNPIPAEFNPCGDQALFPASAVPTDVALHRDGDYLVTTLGGFPFTPGESLVYKVDKKHKGTAVCSTFAPVPASGCEVFADGLTALVGIDVGRKGDVYVVQFADGGVLGAFAPGGDAGSVQVLDRNGEWIGSIGGLTLPGGVATNAKSVLITNKSVFPGAGEVVQARQLN